MKEFILKDRTPPLLLGGLEALILRVPSVCESIRKKYASIQAGYAGEQQLDWIFEKYRFPMNYRVFHDLSLRTSANFQIDTLFMTQSYAIIFEVKNIAGSLKVLENPPQLIRKLDNGEITGFNSPSIQLENSNQLLNDFFESRNISLPIYKAVVLAYSKQCIELPSGSIPYLYPQAVPTFIRKLPITPQLLSEKEFANLANDLLASHRKYIPPPICSIYPEYRSQIMTGVICPYCNTIKMEKYIKGWRCLFCKGTSIDAHKQTIRHWHLLFGGGMTNKDCRNFLNVTSPQIAYRLLQSMDLEVSGAKRNRVYFMNFQLD